MLSSRFCDIVTANPAWLLALVACGKYNSVSRSYLSEGSQIPPSVDEVRRAKHPDGVPVAVIAEAYEVEQGSLSAGDTISKGASGSPSVEGSS